MTHGTGGGGADAPAEADALALFALADAELDDDALLPVDHFQVNVVPPTAIDVAEDDDVRLCANASRGRMFDPETPTATTAKRTTALFMRMIASDQ